MHYFDGAFIIASLAAALYDFIYYKIPNGLIGVLLVLFLVRQLTLTPFGDWLFPNTLLLPLGVIVLIMLIGFVLFRFSLLGAGDVKFLAVTSAWACVHQQLSTYLIVVSILGGVLGLIYLKGANKILLARIWLSSKLTQYFKGPFLSEDRLDLHASEYGTKVMVPYGVAIGLGVLVLQMMMNS